MTKAIANPYPVKRGEKPKRKLFGYKYDWRDTEDWCSEANRPLFATAAPFLAGDGENKTVSLWKACENVIGRVIIHNQTVGDCVAQSWTGGAEFLTCVEIDNGEREKWVAPYASEPFYAHMRVEVGRGRLGNGDGAYGAWGAKSSTEGGFITREKHGRYDLRKYDGGKARSWGRRGKGCPDELEPIMREHPIQTASLVTSWEQCCDAIANGYPIAVCSNQGFQSRRDRDGFARASGSWSHCMLIVGIINENDRRQGACILNSWGPNWISGPKVHNQPDGSFYADADVVDRMLRRNPDSYAMSGFKGFRRRAVDYTAI